MYWKNCVIENNNFCSEKTHKSHFNYNFRLLLIYFLCSFWTFFASDKYAAKINFWKSFIFIKCGFFLKSKSKIRKLYFLYEEVATWALGGGCWCRCNYDRSWMLFVVQTQHVILSFGWVLGGYQKFNDFAALCCQKDFVLLKIIQLKWLKYCWQDWVR